MGLVVGRPYCHFRFPHTEFSLGTDFRIISKISITKLSNYNFKYDNTFFV